MKQNFLTLLFSLIFIHSFHVCATEELEHPSPCEEMAASSFLYQSVNVITGDYSEADTDAISPINRSLKIRRCFSNSEGWHFNPPLKRRVHENHAEGASGLIYHYDDVHNALQSIDSYDPQSDSNVSIARLDWCHFPDSLKISLNDGFQLEYAFDSVTFGKRHCANYITKVLCQGHELYRYNYCNHPFLPKRLLTRVDRPNGDFCINEYYDCKKNSVGDDTVVIEDPVRDGRIGRVKLQRAPVGIDETPIITARYFYHPDHTIVFDALNRKTIYRYHPEGHILAIEDYDNESLYRSERFFWNKETGADGRWRLCAKVWEDGNGRALMARTFTYDTQGNLIAKTLYGNLSGKNCAPLVINQEGIPSNNGVESYTKRFTYSTQPSPVVISESEDNGKVVQYLYHPQKPIKLAEFTGDNTTIYLRRFFDYDQDSKLIKVIVDDGKNQDINDLCGVTERHITAYTYSQNGKSSAQPTLIEDLYLHIPSGQILPMQKTHLTYDNQGRLAAKQTFDAQEVSKNLLTYAYDNFGRLIYEMDDQGSGIKEEYDLVGNLIVETSIENNSIKNERHNVYDHTKRLIRSDEINSEGDHASISCQYNYAGEQIATTDKFGNMVSHAYDTQGRVTKTTFPKILNEHDQAVTPIILYAYDSLDNLIEETDANGNPTHTNYNVRGQPTNRHYPDGTHESFTYNLDGTLKESVDKKGITTAYDYDILGRETAVTVIDAAAHIRRSLISSYSPFHLLKTVQNGKLITQYTYDNAGRLVSKEQSFPEGKQHVNYIYDASGRLYQQMESWGAASDETSLTEYLYDSQGTLLKTVIKDSNGNILKENSQTTSPTSPCHAHTKENIVINSRGQSVLQTTTTDFQGSNKKTVHDALGRVESIAITDPFENQIQYNEYRYDAAGNKVKETIYSNGTISRINRWNYDLCNRVKMEIEAADSTLTRITHYHYNALGQLETITKPDGIVITHHYTAYGQLKNYYSSDFSFKYRYFYDDHGNLIKVEDKIHQNTTNRKYDTFGNVIHEELGNGLQLSNAYDAINRRTSLIFADGSSVAFSYDPLYLREITRFDKYAQPQYTHLYSQYNLNGDVTEISLAAGLGNLSLNYDKWHRCLSISCDQWSQKINEIDFDACGNIKAMHGNDSNGSWQSEFTYNETQQLTTENGPFTHTYAYDDQHNRIAKDDASYQVDILNRLTAIGDTLYDYDLNGNITETKTHTKKTSYRYDALNRLITIETPGDTAITFVYDAFHRRLSKSTSTWDSQNSQWKMHSKCRYLYDGEREIGTVNDQGQMTSLRVLGNGSMGIGQSAEIGAAIAMELDAHLYVPIHDHRGNVSCLLSADSGHAAETYRYSAFGEVAIFSPAGSILHSSALHNPWMFASKRYDSETGLIYFGKRCYDPEIGRWTTKDPIGAFDGSNPYQYLHNRPLSSIDLYGLLSLSSTWQSATGWISSVSSHMYAFKKKNSYTEHMRDEWDQTTHQAFSRGFLQLSGYYEHPLDAGRTPFGEEISEKVRVTLINGILNVRTDLEDSMKLFSSTHGDTVIHYVFRPTEGWSKDLFNSLLSKLGYTSSHAQLLASTWKEMIQEMGGIEGGGTILHYAHSIGAADTNIAKKLLSPEEQRMIQVVTLGSPSMISNDAGFASTINYVSKRDGVCLLDPVGYVKGWLNPDSNVEFLGSFWGVPLIDHTLFTDSYGGIIKDLGRSFIDTYSSF